MNRLCLLLALVAATFSLSAEARHQPKSQSQDASTQNQPGLFDYYALSLSWAPSYCATHAADQSECGTGKRYGFVLHGLWPQFEKGYPQSCGNTPLSSDEQAQYASLYPSTNLMQHEWSKHGTCSGLSAADYFTLSGKLKDGVAIPDAYQLPAQPFRTTSADLASAFVSANPSLSPGSVLAICTGGGRFLQEIHVCFDKSGTSRDCSSNDVNQAAKSCGQSNFLVQNVR
ncbi:ribonuclease T2 family protein [Andreprevotia chitinilytica]|uniref:ribonuclease T2 family protein n=1 Tax=Andreprevotia chitinilytica TaxID=396808 RepID=UPI00054D268C|nr:ribonuclease T2 [Andreprevotia chitinilytica]